MTASFLTSTVPFFVYPGRSGARSVSAPGAAMDRALVVLAFPKFLDTTELAVRALIYPPIIES